MDLSGVWDWTFFWNTFAFILKTCASFIIIIVAIKAVGMLIQAVLQAVRNNRDA